MRLTNTLFSASVLVALSACGGDDPGSLTATEAFSKIANTYCERAFACEETSPEPLPYASVAECADAFEAVLNEDSAAFQASIEAGRIAWNEEDAAYCAGLIETAVNGVACTDFWGENDALEIEDARCEGLGEGLVADGDACTINDDCANDGSECFDGLCAQPQ